MTAADIAKVHRIDKAQVIQEVTSAGFQLAGEGKFLNRPTDDPHLPIFDKKVRGHTGPICPEVREAGEVAAKRPRRGIS